MPDPSDNWADNWVDKWADEWADDLRVRVRYSECDPMGVAHHAVYPLWMEMARTELLRSLGVTYAQMESSGDLLVVVALGVDYKASAIYDDEVGVRARVTRVTPARIEHSYEIRLLGRTNPMARLHAGALLATGKTTLACVDRQGRPKRTPSILTGGAGEGPGG